MKKKKCMAKNTNVLLFCGEASKKKTDKYRMKLFFFFVKFYVLYMFKHSC